MAETLFESITGAIRGKMTARICDFDAGRAITIGVIPSLRPSGKVKLKLKLSGSQDSRLYTSHSYYPTGTVPLPVSNSTIKCGLYKLPPKEEIAIRETLPRREGERNHCILRLVRRLHRIKDLDRSPSHLLEIISAWHSRAYHVSRFQRPPERIIGCLWVY
jgi:hypothetical protein